LTGSLSAGQAPLLNVYIKSFPTFSREIKDAPIIPFFVERSGGCDQGIIIHHKNIQHLNVQERG